MKKTTIALGVVVLLLTTSLVFTLFKLKNAQEEAQDFEIRLAVANLSNGQVTLEECVEYEDYYGTLGRIAMFSEITHNLTGLVDTHGANAITNGAIALYFESTLESEIAKAQQISMDLFGHYFEL